MVMKGSSGGSDLRRAMWAFRREFLVVGLFSMVSNLLMLAPTIYMLQVFDRVLVSRSELTLLVVTLITVFLFAMMAFAEWSRSRVLVRAGVRLDAVLGTRVFNAAFEANLSQSTDEADRALADLTELRQFITGNGALAFFDTPWTPIYLAVLFILHPVLGWVAIGFAILQGLVAWFGHRRVMAPSEETSQAQRDAEAFIRSKLRNAEVVESMGMYGALRARWAARHAVYMHSQDRLQGLINRITAWSKWLRSCQQSIGLGTGAFLVIQGQLTAGAMIASNALMSRALAPIDLLVSSWRGFHSARAAYKRLDDLLAAYPERDEALSRMPPDGAVTLREVSATAEGRAAPILSNVSLEAAPGTVTVVLGPSGSGKSTLARVLVGIWPQVHGEVLLDERPLAGWDRAELGPHLGYLPQDIELFDGTIAENIARFSKIDPDKVIGAAKSAGLHEMILRLPKGYETRIGEGGKVLSGGQRQRLALARAMYGNPRVVVLDEPNANLDEVGENALLQAVRAMKAAGSTVFLITHRPGVLQLADQILVLRDGRVQLLGPRDDVLARLQIPPPVPPSPVPPPAAPDLPAVAAR